MNPEKSAKVIRQLNEKVRVLKRERTDMRQLLLTLELLLEKYRRKWE